MLLFISHYKYSPKIGKLYIQWKRGGIKLENKILIGIMVISALVLIISTLFYYPGFLKKLLMRLLVGVIGITGTNWILAMTGIGIYVGINAFSGLILMFLGTPGYLLLYAIETYITYQ